MSLKKQDQLALILIDIQQAFDDEEYWGGTRNNRNAEENAKRLLDYWRENGLPYYFIFSISPKIRMQSMD